MKTQLAGDFKRIVSLREPRKQLRQQPDIPCKAFYVEIRDQYSVMKYREILDDSFFRVNQRL